MFSKQKDSVFGYSFKNQDLLDLALTHRSFSSNNNERLEFLGDSVLDFVISAEITKRYPRATEGELTRIRASLVNGEKLAEIARYHNVGNIILLGDGEKKSGGWTRTSILANILESLFGAVYLDSDFDTVKKLILAIFSKSIDLITLDSIPKDPKTLLQEHLQHLGLALPKYHTVEVSGPPHDQIFTVECRTALDQGSQVAQGTSKRKAEQEAASQLLAKIGKP